MPGLRDLLRVLRHRDFRLLWIGNAASAIGDRIVRVALALYVIGLTGSATDVGIVLAAYSLPLIVFLLVGGVLADRLPRHLVVVVTDVVRCALHALLAVLVVTREARIWQIVAIGVLFATAEAFYRPAVTALLPQTVPEPEIQEASALRGMSDNLAEFAGPALATLLVLGLGPAAAFGLDAVTFAVSAALLVRIRPRARGLVGAPTTAPAATTPAAPATAPPAASVWADIVAGFEEVRSRAWVWATLAAFSVALFVMVAPLYVVGPVVARERYGDVAVFGYVLAAFGVGTIAATFVAIRWRPRFPMRRAMALILLLPVGCALYPAGAPLAVVLVAMVAGGAGTALFDVLWLTALAERIPPDKLSRVTSYDWAVSFGLMPLGYILAGPVADAVGASELLLGGAIVGFAALALGLLPRETRMLARLETAPPPGARAAARRPQAAPP
ncbi:MAG TPA: MFS transporter [Solirubrobacteraceae bacterium]|jgi:MFS family permease